ncbi:glycosyltransferase family 2 protein [Candidatus Woesearchaeota archaeon]|nr:glycosyltransferase family 2 protein [Candidatus Woesearchaeota archaeon]
MEKKIFIVIPAFNEEKSITNVVSELLNAGYKNLIVIDDCSRDKTSEKIKQFPVFLLRHCINRGQGASLKTGIDFALEQGADIIVTFDSDGQHRIEDLHDMINPVINEEADISLGSRFLKKTKVPFLRKILLKGSVWVMFLFYRIKMSDAHNGFRVMSRKAAEKIDISCDRMAHASEIIEEIHRKKLNFKEIPITIKYDKETLKKGHGSYFQAFKVLFGMIFKKIAR